ncbi:MAG: hypothetical protein LBQ60_01260 [Bacteroidales bacterium]|jgi:hypothetical protein|nr:hypothetical protein [Bacteroidales bacterium]
MIQEIDHLPDGLFGGTYFVKRPDGYTDPDNIIFTDKTYREKYDCISDWVNKELERHSLFPKFVTKSGAVTVNTLHLLKRIDQTQYLINQDSFNEEWYENIVHYTEAMVCCFTKPYVGLPFFIKEIKLYVQSIHLTEDKKAQLINLLDTYYINGKVPDFYEIDFLDSKTLEDIDEKKKHTPDNISQLRDIFGEWLEILPFEIGCFNQGKDYFQNRISDFLIKNNAVKNKYSDFTFSSFRRPHELIEFLIDTTKEMLQKVNSVKWGKTANNSEIEKRKYEIEDANHLIKQKELLLKVGSYENSFIKLIRKWLKNEKEYFKRLKERDYKSQKQVIAKEETKKNNTIQSDRHFSDFLTCNEKQKQTILSNIKTLSNSIITGRDWAVVLLALCELNYITLPNKGRNIIYQAFKDEFNIDTTDKNLNKYISSYMYNKGLESGVTIDKSEVESMLRKLTEI